MDYVVSGIQNAAAKGLTAADVAAMGYAEVHALCGKDPDQAGDVFVWEAVRLAVAAGLENRVEIEAEDGTIIHQD